MNVLTIACRHSGYIAVIYYHHGVSLRRELIRHPRPLTVMTSACISLAGSRGSDYMRGRFIHYPGS
jgi:hypothetical protein